MKDSTVLQLPVSTIAYIGDAVYSLYCRIKYLDLIKVHEIHRKVNKVVSRNGQARNLDRSDESTQ